MAQAHEMRLLLADNQAGATNSISLAVKGSDLLGDREFGRDTGLRGTRSRYACGDRVVREVVGGSFELQPSPAELDWFIERMMGDNISGYPAGAAAPGETLPQFYGYLDKGPEIFRYDLLVISRLSLSVREGDFLNMRVDLVGSAETSGVTWPGTPPAIACADEYIAADVAFTLDGDAYPFKSLEMVIDNFIAPSQHENAVLRTVFESEDLAVMVNGVFGYRTDTKDLYRRAIAGDTASIVMNNGTSTYTITFGNLKVPGRGPTVPPQGEVTMQLAMEARRTAGAPVLSIAKT